MQIRNLQLFILIEVLFFCGSIANAATATVNSPASQLVNINTAPASTLMKIAGINAPKARAIVRYRRLHHGFKQLTELKNVKGFKKLTDNDWLRYASTFNIPG